MDYQREKQNISASELLANLAQGNDINLSQCKITGQLDINRLFDKAEKFDIEKLHYVDTSDIKTVTFEQKIVFDKCLFEENVVFTGPWSEKDSVCVKFESDIVFNSSEFKAQARFRNAVFSGMASFDGCSFEGVMTFANAVIHGDAKFRTVNFGGYSLFGNCVFKSSARFTNSHFVKGVRFAAVKFEKDSDFNGVYSSSRAVPAIESIHFGLKIKGDDESFWRFVKQSAQDAGYYRLAGECFYKERCAGLWFKLRGGVAYDRFSPWKKTLRLISGVRLLPEIIFGKWLFGYGERPIRVLLASAVIIILCGFYFSMDATLAHRTQQALSDGFDRFMEGLYFSTITFTTLGYGDLYPAENSTARLVAMLEAIAGGSLMALFVVCLAKRFSRS